MKVLLVGSGMAGIGLAEEVRKISPEITLQVITQENHGYYSRPLLSHGFSREDIESKIILKNFSLLKEKGIDIVECATVNNLQPKEKKISITQANGKQAGLTYDKLVLAIGSAAFIPPPWIPFKNLFSTLNSLADLKMLRKNRASLLARGQKPHWAIIGGGLIGCEVASDLNKAGDKVSIFHAADRLMERQLSPEKSGGLREHFTNLGVEISLNQNITRFESDPATNLINLTEKSGPMQSKFHGVLVATGFKPRTELAMAAGLKCDRGIVTNEFLQTSEADIFAAGDVAQVGQNLYPFVAPIRNQVVWLASYLTGKTTSPWTAPTFTPVMKIHGFK